MAHRTAQLRKKEKGLEKMDKDSLIAFYREKSDSFSAEREGWLNELQKCQVSQEEMQKLRAEIQTRVKEVGDLQQSLTECNYKLFQERQKGLRLAQDNDDLRLEVTELTRKLHTLLSISPPSVQEITYFHPYPIAPNTHTTDPQQHHQQQQQQPGSGVEVSGCRAMLRLTIFNEEDMLFKSVDGGRRTLMSRDIEMPDPLPALEKYCGTMEEARAIMEETVFTSYRLTALASGKGFVIAGPGMLTALRVCEDPYVFGASTEPVTLRTLEIHWQGHKESPVTTSKGDIDIRQQFFTSCATLYHPTEQERSQLAIPPASRLPHPKPTSKHTRDSRETNTNTVLRQQHHPGTSIPRHPKASGWRPPREPSGERVGSRLVSGRECEVRERKEGWRKEAKVFEEGVEQLLLGEGRSNLYSFSFQYMPAPHSPLNPKRTPGTTGTTRGRPPSPSPPPASRVLPRKKLQLLSVDSMPDWHKTFMQAPDDEEQTRFHLVKVRGVGPAADPLAPSTEPLSLPAHICSISHRADIVSLPPFSFKALPPPPPAPPAPPAAAAAAAAAGASSSSNGNSSSSRGEGGRWRRRLSMSTVVPQSMETIDSCYWPVYPSERKEFLFHEDVNVLAAEPCHAAHSMVLWAAGGRGLVYHVPSRCVVCTFIKPDHTGSTEGRRS
uniref:Uncharacterized protein n=1 Tax=Vitrella brassicaformis TaxID=1169539 RepID=A0A7S1PAK2_9ALVE|mmetsp:Transcript_47554/g.118848  ORF Transcript_47554/g.118848 Transcript_47554/m.118848 type:complete len:665 (+) Transcript_47554:2181-4175(+)